MTDKIHKWVNALHKFVLTFLRVFRLLDLFWKSRKK